LKEGSHEKKTRGRKRKKPKGDRQPPREVKDSLHYEGKTSQRRESRGAPRPSKKKELSLIPSSSWKKRRGIRKKKYPRGKSKKGRKIGRGDSAGKDWSRRIQKRGRAIRKKIKEKSSSLT